MNIQAFNEETPVNSALMGDNYNNHTIKTSFELKNVNVAFANCLRRSFSSMVPTVTFDDTYHNDKSLNSIKIIKNTSSLHNEFLSQRLSLLPINIEKGTNLSIKTNFDNETSKRKWEFIYDDNIPTFSLKKINTKSDGNRNSIINVTTEDFEINLNINGQNVLQPVNNYFPKDPFTGLPILINKLKSNLIDNTKGEELDIICVPKIEFGKNCARNDPTGTSVCTYKIDESRIDQVFSQKITYLNKERESKGLPEYQDHEIDKLRKSFELLDKERVFHKNDKGEPNHFELSVESIGFMSSFQIICDSIASLKLSLLDIRNSFSIIPDTPVRINTNNLIKIHHIEKGVRFIIKDENHTIGNIIKHYLCELFLSVSGTDKPLKIAGYVMPHPTINELEFKLVLNDTISDNLMKEYITSSNSTLTKDSLDACDQRTIMDIYITIMFIKSINYTINQFDLFKKELKRVNSNKSCEPTFHIADNDQYITKNNIYN